jgi:hypothetical protein
MYHYASDCSVFLVDEGETEDKMLDLEASRRAATRD